MNTSFFRKALILTATLGIAVAPLGANAGEVYHRVRNEQARINQGIRSGQVTRGEDRNLDSRLDGINAQRRRDLRANGGTLTRGEQANLNRRENNLSNSIYYDKHNLARQPGAPVR